MARHKHARLEILGTDLLTHPAVKAWAELRPGQVVPGRISILKETEKSAVYRLEGVGPADSAVIAKRCPQTTGVVERIIYEEVLRFLPLPTLRFFGFVEEGDSHFCWLFVEDAGGEEYSPELNEHRRLAGRWLGLFHTSAARLAAAVQLPARGSGHYLEHLYSARDTLREILSHPGLVTEELNVLKSLLSHCDLLKSHWSQIERFCAGMPQTLVHGDFGAKNVRVRTRPNGIDFLPFDWETAGWGVPAADLSRLTRWVSPDLTAYWSVVEPAWGHLAAGDIQQLARFGSLFRLLAALDWAITSLAVEGVKGALEKYMQRYLRFYEDRLANALQAVQ